MNAFLVNFEDIQRRRRVKTFCMARTFIRWTPLLPLMGSVWEITQRVQVLHLELQPILSEKPSMKTHQIHPLINEWPIACSGQPKQSLLTLA